MDDALQAALKDRSVLGAMRGQVGLLLFFVSILVTFVVLVEYDPQAQALQEEGQIVKGTVLAILEPIPARHSLAPLSGDIGYPLRVAFQDANGRQRTESTFGYVSAGELVNLRPGSEIDLLVSPGEAPMVAALWSMPPTPRGQWAWAFPAILLALTALLLIMDPVVLYGKW